MSKPKAPATPDYAGAAKEQGSANLNSAIATNTLGRIDQVTPQGSIKYTDTGSYTLPDGTTIPRSTATTTLSGGEQALYDQNNQISQSLNKLALQGTDYVGSTVNKPFDASVLGDRVNTIGGAPTDNPALAMSVPGQAVNFGADRVNTVPGSNDYSADRDRVSQALMSRMQPGIDQREGALRSRLANQGLAAGSEAYNNEYQQFNQGRNDAELATMLAGGQEQSRLQGMDINAGNFTNQSRMQGLAEAAGLQGLDINNANFKNSAIAQALGLAGQRQGMDLTSGNFTNQSRQQGIQEQSFFRDQPLNTLNALRTGNQTNMPQFQGNSSANVAAAPIYAATNDQYKAQVDAYQTAMGPWNALIGGVTGIAGSALGGFLGGK